MTFEETLRAIVREELKNVLRTDLLPQLGDGRCANSEEDRYLSLQKAGEFIDIHPDTIRKWIKEGRLHSYRAGRELRVLRSELCRFLEAADSVEQRGTAEEEAATILGRGAWDNAWAEST